MIRSIPDRKTFQRFRSAPVVRRGPVRVRYVAPLATDSGVASRVQATLSPSPIPGEIRLAFAIGKPVGNAVVRNRIRRRLRSAVVLITSTRGMIPSGSYLVAADVRVLTEPFADLAEKLRHAMVDAAGRRASLHAT